jgi:hypothetical protein
MVLQELSSTVNETCFQQISRTVEHACEIIEDLKKVFNKNAETERKNQKSMWSKQRNQFNI